MSPLAPSAVLLLLWGLPAASAVRMKLQETTATLHIDPVGLRGECSKDVAVPPSGQGLQKYFDGFRSKYGILGESAGFLGEGAMVDPKTCTKKDVCLLMRQLDMDFYSRARAGLMQDIDYQVQPTKGWVSKGTCNGQEHTRGFKMKAVMDEMACRAEAKKQGVTTFKGFMNSKTDPAGCVIKKVDAAAQAFVNTAISKVEATLAYGKSRVQTQILCEMDRSLSESAAAYYSPYKMKPSMKGREAMSTSCSFGMYAFLAKLRETMSPCAKILTYKTHAKIGSAQAGLDLAAMLDSQGNTAGGDKLRKYVESVRQKYVLIDTVANKWCPGIWTGSAAVPGATCLAPRVMSWTTEAQELAKAEDAKFAATTRKPTSMGGSTKKPAGGRLEAAEAAHGVQLPTSGNQNLLDDLDDLLASLSQEDKAADFLIDEKNPDEADSSQLDSRGKPIKSALTEQACSGLADENLADLLEGKPQAPPDFFASASIPEQ